MKQLPQSIIWYGWGARQQHPGLRHTPYGSRTPPTCHDIEGVGQPPLHPQHRRLHAVDMEVDAPAGGIWVVGVLQKVGSWSQGLCSNQIFSVRTASSIGFKKIGGSRYPSRRIGVVGVLPQGCGVKRYQFCWSSRTLLKLLHR